MLEGAFSMCLPWLVSISIVFLSDVVWFRLFVPYCWDTRDTTPTVRSVCHEREAVAIKEIERLMLRAPDEDQLEKPHGVLSHCLLEAEGLVAERKRFGSNTQIIEAFLAAKSVGACSATAIRYYSTTLEAFAGDMGSPSSG